MMVQSKRKHVGTFILYFNVNFNVLKQNYCALVGVIKEREGLEEKIAKVRYILLCII